MWAGTKRSPSSRRQRGRSITLRDSADLSSPTLLLGRASEARLPFPWGGGRSKMSNRAHFSLTRNDYEETIILGKGGTRLGEKHLAFLHKKGATADKGPACSHMCATLVLVPCCSSSTKSCVRVCTLASNLTLPDGPSLTLPQRRKRCKE